VVFVTCNELSLAGHTVRFVVVVAGKFRDLHQPMGSLSQTYRPLYVALDHATSPFSPTCEAFMSVSHPVDHVSCRDITQRVQVLQTMPTKHPNVHLINARNIRAAFHRYCCKLNKVLGGD
jgi:hypothetical protein